MSIQLVGLAERGKNFFADHSRLCRGLLCVLAKVLKHDNEFVTAQPGNRVNFSDRGCKANRNLLKQKIPGLMTEGNFSIKKLEAFEALP